MQKKEESIAKENLYRTIEQKEEALNIEKKTNSLKFLLDKVLELEKSHDFETAITLYSNMLSLKDDKDFDEFQPLILDRLAICSKKMNKMTDAFLWRNIVGTPGLIYIFEFKQDGAV